MNDEIIKDGMDVPLEKIPELINQCQIKLKMLRDEKERLSAELYNTIIERDKLRAEKAELVETLKKTKQIIHYLCSLSSTRGEADRMYDEVDEVLAKVKEE